MGKKQKRLTVEQFTLQAIERLRNLERSKGIHVVYSGFNAAFREYFPDRDLREEIQKLVEAGKIDMVLRRGGPMIFLPGEGPEDMSAEKALRRILGEDPE